MADSGPAWSYDGRHYELTLASDVGERDGMGLELADVGPAPARGLVVEIFYRDTGGEMTFTAFTDTPLPLALVERVVVEAHRRLPPRA